MADIDTTIASIEGNLAENAAAPKSITTPSAAITEHSLPDQITALEYLGRKRARRSPLGGAQIRRAVPNGTVGPRSQTEANQ